MHRRQAQERKRREGGEGTAPGEPWRFGRRQAARGVHCAAAARTLVPIETVFDRHLEHVLFCLAWARIINAKVSCSRMRDRTSPTRAARYLPARNAPHTPARMDGRQMNSRSVHTRTGAKTAGIDRDWGGDGPTLGQNHASGGRAGPMVGCCSSVGLPSWCGILLIVQP